MWPLIFRASPDMQEGLFCSEKDSSTGSVPRKAFNACSINGYMNELDKVYPTGYIIIMIEIRKTESFAKWIDGLRDIRARARVLARLQRLACGNVGDAKPIGEGVSELRIDYGPGYRV